jgi:hypothetical protein
MMRTVRRVVLLPVLAGALLVVPLPSGADQLPDNCTKDRGTVTCSTFEGPGNNQAGVGTTTNTETQGNKSPEEQQDLEDTQSCKPPKSQGAPCP